MGSLDFSVCGRMPGLIARFSQIKGEGGGGGGTPLYATGMDCFRMLFTTIQAILDFGFWILDF
jgi:hypothetical protein